jgi:ADP-ribose pyrophosphatase YjhB (NUDIX family)
MKFAGKTVAAIIEFLPNKILLIKRDTVPFRGYWALPGGRVEPGEAVERAVEREVKEETGLDVVAAIKVGEFHEQGMQDGVSYDYYPTYFVVNNVGGRLRRQKSEIQEIRLFSLSSIPKVFAFEHAKMIKDYIALYEAKEKGVSL